MTDQEIEAVLLIVADVLGDRFPSHPETIFRAMDDIEYKLRTDLKDEPTVE